MRLYYICECCREIYRECEVEGPQGTAELSGLCPDCLLEVGGVEESGFINGSPSYN